MLYYFAVVTSSSCCSDATSVMIVILSCTLGKHIRDKVVFHVQPTDPQKDIKSTGNRELW
jgi:hypothetical protein